MPKISNDHIRLTSSERCPLKGSTLIGLANENEVIKATISQTSFEWTTNAGCNFFKTSLSQRQRMSDVEFAKKYWASESNLAKVAAFDHENRLKVIETSAAYHNVVVSWTVAQMNKAFIV